MKTTLLKPEEMKTTLPKPEEMKEETISCTNCGCPDPVNTYDGLWCAWCHNQM